MTEKASCGACAHYQGWDDTRTVQFGLERSADFQSGLCIAPLPFWAKGTRRDRRAIDGEDCAAFQEA